MSITNKFKIEDKNILEAIKDIEKKAIEGKDGNFEVFKREMNKNELGQMKEGKRYIEQRSNDEDPRIRIKIGNQLYHINLTKTD